MGVRKNATPKERTAMRDILYTTGACSLGSMLIAKSERGICAILLGDHPQDLLAELRSRYPGITLTRSDAEFQQLAARVIDLIEAPGDGPDLLLDIRGTVFQQRVWEAIREIPAGSTTTYSDIAQHIGAPAAVRAVARACAANSLAVAIPCHRVVGRDGRLSGYRWGVERKRALLQRERAG
jgi:AraC family transcriptional regulator of adaptative response/methylated-DNA-[protein]-cysteine methyltransferase